MNQLNPLPGRIWAAVIGVAMLVGGALPVPAQLMQKLTFKDLVDKSDQIFIATCAKKRTFMRNGGIVTHYELKPSEFIKGQMSLSSTGNIEMEERGGRLTGQVPMAQFVPGMANMAPGEEVLLFTAQPKSSGMQLTEAQKRSPVSPTSPHIVGRWQGRFSVFRHPETGEKLVAQANMSTVPGSAANPRIQQMMIAQNQKFAGASATSGKMGLASATATTPSPVIQEALKQSHNLADKIDKAAQVAKAGRDRAALHAKDQAGEIYQYEPLSAIKSRIADVLKSEKQ